MTTLTSKEQIAFTAIIAEGLSNVCGKHPSVLLEDNCSWFYPNDIVGRTDYNKEQVAGFLSSLEKKGFIANAGDAADGGFAGDACRADWYITFEGLEHQIQLLKEVDIEEAVTGVDALLN